MRHVWWIGGLLAACGGPAVYEDVVYDVRFGDATSMDIHVPASADAGAGAAATVAEIAGPAVMLIHGGGWRYGSKEAYTEAAERLAAAGYVAATINYRLVPEGTYPAAAKDCLCALSFLRANAAAYGIDPARIAVTGYSAGGHLAALVGTGADVAAHQPDCEWGPAAPPAAVIPGDAVYDFAAGGADGSDLVRDFLGGTRQERPEAYASASPITHVRPGAPPVLVVHGSADIVPIATARELADRLRAAGGDVRMLELGGAGHIVSAVTASDGAYLQAATETPEAWAVQLDFLARTVGAP